MDTTIEKLQSESNEIRVALESLQKQVQNEETEKKKQELVAQAEEAKKQAESLLQSESDENTKAQLEEIKKQLEYYTSELQALRTEVKEQAQPEKQQETIDSTDQTSSAASPSSAPEKEKNFLQKGIDWIKGDEKETHHTAKAIGRGALVASGIGIGVYGLGKLFGRWGKKEEKADSSEGKEEKPKKTSRWKKALGRGAGILGGTWLGRGLLTGNWDFFGRNPFGKGKEADATDTNSEKHKSYEHFIKNPENKEKAENYEGFGNNIDSTYQALYDKELKAGYQDELEMERISKELNKEKKYKGVVPFCLDNQYGSVEEILYQNTNFKNILNGGVHQMKTYIQNLAADQLQSFVDSYLSKFPSRGILEGFKGSLKEKVDKWVLENQQSKEELQYFFRQGVRVQTYLFEKRDQLKQKVIQKTAQAWGISPQELLKDEEKLNTALNADSDYNLFLHSSIADATEILKRNHLFDHQIGEHVQEAVKQLDEQRDKILGSQPGEKDILQKINEKTDENLTESEKDQLAFSCDNIIKDVDEKISEAVETSMWNIYGDLWGTEDAAIRQYFSKAGMENAFNTIKQVIRDKQIELKNGNLTLDKAKALANTINNLLAMKKEIILGANTLEREEDENGNIFYRIPGFAKGSWDNFLKGFNQLTDGEWSNQLEGAGNVFSSLLGVGTTIAIIGGSVRIAGGHVAGKTIMNVGVKTALAPAYLPGKLLGKAGKKFRPLQRLSDKMLYAAPNRVLGWMKFGGKDGPEKLIESMKLGYISLNDASDILKRKTNGFFGDKKILEARKLKFKIQDENAKGIKYAERIFDEFLSSTKMGDTYLQALKSDRTLYEKIIENFDRSPKIMEAIRGDQSVDELRKIVDEVENFHTKIISQTKQAAKESVQKVTEGILETKPYKILANELKNERNILKSDLALLDEANDAAKIKQITKQLERLDTFEQVMKRSSLSELEAMQEVYQSISKVAKGKSSLKHLDTIGKLLDEGSDAVKDAIKNMDGRALTDAVAVMRKANKLGEISDEAIKPVSEILQDIKVKNLAKSADEIMTGLKTMIRFLTKLT